jgi:hypothetical protein
MLNGQNFADLREGAGEVTLYVEEVSSAADDGPRVETVA